MKANKYRTHMCIELTETDSGKLVRVSGFVENIRDHGGVLFLDLRDSSGVLQVVSNDDSIFEGITRESSITIEGTIRKRDEDDYNEKISTGTIELLVDKLEVLNKSKNILPFEVITSKHLLLKERGTLLCHLVNIMANFMLYLKLLNNLNNY